MGVELRTAPAGALWLVYQNPRGGFDYMPEGTALFADERAIARRLSLAQAIAKVDALHLDEASPPAKSGLSGRQGSEANTSAGTEALDEH